MNMLANRRIHREEGLVHSKVHQLGTRVLADDTGVVTRSDLIGGLGKGAGDEDDLFGIAGHSRCESGVAGDCGCGTAGTTSGASIEACVACCGLLELLAMVFSEGKRVLNS